MKTTKKTLLLASAAVMALGLGFSSDAKAFDDVDWEWNKIVTSVENITITVDDEFDLTGLVEIEKAQINIGDVTADSTVQGINNNTPGLGVDGTVIIDEVASINLLYENPNGGTVANVGSSVLPGSPPNVVDIEVLGSELTESPATGAHNDLVDIRLTAEVDVEAIEGVNDAVDLPKIESIATAVANNQSIESTVGVQLHDAQYNFGGFRMEDLIYTEDTGEAIGTAIGLGLAYIGADVTDNPHNDLAVGLTLAAALGVIEQGSVTATSTVGGLHNCDTNCVDDIGIHNAFVESNATAVGNNISVDVDATSINDAFLIADITQFNFADVSAYSSVSGVDVNNYVGFGAAGMGPLSGDDITPLISSVATAVGNNVSISVSNAGAIELPGTP